MENQIDLKEYIDTRFEATQKAVDLANENLKIQLKATETFINQLNANSGNYISRDELSAKLDSIEKGRRDNISLWIALASIIISIIIHFWK